MLGGTKFFTHLVYLFFDYSTCAIPAADRYLHTSDVSHDDRVVFVVVLVVFTGRRNPVQGDGKNVLHGTAVVGGTMFLEKNIFLNISNKIFKILHAPQRHGLRLGHVLDLIGTFYS